MKKFLNKSIKLYFVGMFFFNTLQKIINLAPKVCKGKYILWTHVTSSLFTALHCQEFTDNYLKKKV